MDIESLYNLIKTLHIVFMTTWMAGLFYLPRLFVYHALSKKKSDMYITFIIMERKLFNYIMNPSLILTWVLGIWLVQITKSSQESWLIAKVLLVFLLTIFHGYCGKVKNEFSKYRNIKGHKFYRIVNEIPTVIFIFIVILVVFKPFN
tara:strand:- start:10 stop:450 length:441 start_codon:yes stop_codon:yes gene_type:complete